MGLGKTICVIAFLTALYCSNEQHPFLSYHTPYNLKPSLIICPATLIDQWSSEIYAWTMGPPPLHPVEEDETKAINREERPEDNAEEDKEEQREEETKDGEVGFVVVKSSEGAEFERSLEQVTKKRREKTLFICSYELFRSKQDELLAEDWRVCVLDEGQRVKNPVAKITQAVTKVKSDFRLIMSGTPIQNSLVELWSLFNFVNPGMLGTLGEFEENFKEPILKAGYRRARPTDKWEAKECA